MAREIVTGKNGADAAKDSAAPVRRARRKKEQPEPAPGGAAAPERQVQVRVALPGANVDDDRLSSDLRPRHFSDYVGQRTVVEPLSIAAKAAQKRGETLDHILFHGPPGLGKTTLAHIIAREMDAVLTHTSGPALERPADVVGLLSNLKKGDLIFIDEIHRLSRAVEEYLYSAMEDYRVDFVTGSGAFAKTISLPLERFTLIGSTTRAGMLSAPLRDRFGLTYHLEYYSDEELAQVVRRSAGILRVKIEPDAAAEVARRARGTPRVANRLLRRVRDYAEVKSTARARQEPVPVDLETAADALRLEGVDGMGLDRLDRMYLQVLGVNYGGGPAGVEALAASLNEEQPTLVDVVEPFLLKIGYIVRTPAGRRCTPAGMRHIGATAIQGRSGGNLTDTDQPRLI